MEEINYKIGSIGYSERFGREEIVNLPWEKIPPQKRVLLVAAAKITMGIKIVGDERFCKARGWLFNNGFELYDIPYELLYPDEDKDPEVVGQEEFDFN